VEGESGYTMLDCFQLVCKIICVWIPDSLTVFEYGAHKSFIGTLLDVWITHINVMMKEVEGVVHFSCWVIDMLVPAKVLRD
jgi:hypothetical protein